MTRGILQPGLSIRMTLSQYYKDGHMAKCIKWLQSGTDIKIEMLTMVYNACVGYVIELHEVYIWLEISLYFSFGVYIFLVPP